MRPSVSAMLSQRSADIKNGDGLPPVTGFARVEEFEAARLEKVASIRQAKQKAKAARTKYDLDPRSAYKVIKYIDFDALCYEWQLESVYLHRN